jgi:cytochrome c55X
MSGDKWHRWRHRVLAALLLLPLMAQADMTTARQQQLLYLLRQDCGSCHGLTLRGGLGPALTPQALYGKSAEMLRSVILYGRPGTPMAPWQPFMNAAEATWLVEQLQTGMSNAQQ